MKIEIKQNKKIYPIFKDLKPGDVFRFINYPKSSLYMKTLTIFVKDVDNTFFNMVFLEDGSPEQTSDDTEVELVNAILIEA